MTTKYNKHTHALSSAAAVILGSDAKAYFRLQNNVQNKMKKRGN